MEKVLKKHWEKNPNTPKEHLRANKSQIFSMKVKKYESQFYSTLKSNFHSFLLRDI